MGECFSMEQQMSQRDANHLVKALNHSALVILIFRLIYAIFFAILHLWGLAIFSFCGALVWLGIHQSCLKVYRPISFVAGVVEAVLYTAVSVVELGWNCGAYFPDILFFLVFLTNERLSKRRQIVYSTLLAVFLLALFLVAVGFSLGRYVTPLYLNILFAFNLIEGSLLLIIFMWTVETEKISTEAEIVTANQQLMTLANTDPLTNLLNRRNMMARIEEEKAKVDQGGQPFSLIMVDVDDFKQINDEYGHDCGDFVLVSVAERIRYGVRKNDLICRWGGDEFLILLFETDRENCQLVAEKVRLRVITTPFIYHDVDIPVTVTLGVTQCDRYSGVGFTIRKADLALYKGKQEGKNRSVYMS